MEKLKYDVYSVQRDKEGIANSWFEGEFDNLEEAIALADFEVDSVVYLGDEIVYDSKGMYADLTLEQIKRYIEKALEDFFDENEIDYSNWKQWYQSAIDNIDFKVETQMTQKELYKTYTEWFKNGLEENL